jgi:2-deoxy-D-gluconate 3-dehydrogenase
MEEQGYPGSRLFSLAGQVALVTGGAYGIGAAIAELLAYHGARVALTYRTGRRSEAVLPDLLDRLEHRSGTRPFAVPLDVRSAAEVAVGVDTVASELGRIDVLVNNAGLNVPQLAFEVSEETWDLILDTNLKGTFLVAQAVGRVMCGQPRGDDQWSTIVNIASDMGLVGYAERAAYCASKAGVVNLTRVLALEWAEHRIRVNAVAPAFVRTPLTEPMLADPAVECEVLRRTPLRRIGDPEDVAAAVLYLCTAASGYVTGHTLAVDGGWTAW